MLDRGEGSWRLTSLPSFVWMMALSCTVSMTPRTSTISLANMSLRSLIFRSCSSVCEVSHS